MYSITVMSGRIACIADAAYCCSQSRVVSVCVFVCLLVTSRSPAKPVDTSCVSADIRMSLSLVGYRYRPTIAPTRATNRGAVISHWRCSTKISLYISETVQDRDIVTMER